MLEAALEAADAVGDESASPLGMEQLQVLATHLAALGAAHLVPRVQGEHLARLLDVLDCCIARGLGADLGPHAVASTTPDALSRSLTSLEAASCTLQVLCSRGVSPQWASQERVAQLIDLVKGQLGRNVLTWYDPHRRRAAAAQAGGGAPAGQGAPVLPVAPPSTTPRKRRKTGKHALVAVALSDGDGEPSDGEGELDPDADETDGVPSEADDDDEATPKRSGGRSVTPKAKGRAAAAAAAAKDEVAIGPVPTSVKRVLDRLCGGHGGGLLSQVGTLAACTCLHDAAVVAAKDCALWAAEPPLGGGGPAATAQGLLLLHTRGVAMLGRLFGCYPHHRGLIIDELVGAAMRMPPASRKPCRVVPISASLDVGAGITPVAAALLTCIQSAATYPDDGGPAPGIAAGRSKGGYEDEAGGTTGGVLAPHTWSASFWTSLLGRGGAVAKSAEVDHKGVVAALLADCCTCLTSPEWPASPLLLLSFVKQLTSGGAASDGRAQFGLAAGEAAVRSVSMTWLGQVVARLRATLATHEHAPVWAVASLTRLAGGTTAQGGDDEAVAGLMRHAWSHAHMLQHARTSDAGLFAPPTDVDLPPDGLLHALQAGADGSDAHLALLQQCTLLLLASAAPEPMAVSAHRFSLSQWAADCRRATVGADRKEVVASTDAWLKPQWMPPDGAPPLVAPPPGAIHAARQLPSRAVMALTAALLATRPLARHGDGLLSKLADGLADTSPIVRASAVKAVSLVCDADPHALAAPSLRDSIVQLLGDPATSVRAEAVELIGRAAARVMPSAAAPAHRASGDVSEGVSPGAPALLEQYFDALAIRVFDTGVSVRKRAMLILRDAASCPGFSRATQALARLVGRIHDEEESVQALAVKVFTSAWCDPQPAGSTLDRAQQFADVAEALYAGPTGLNIALPLGPASPLCALLSRMLTDGGSSVRPGLVTLAEALREKVLEAEEQHGCAADGGPSAPSGSRLGGFARSDGHTSAVHNNATAAAGAAWHKTLPACLALHALCVADASLCCPRDDPSRLVATLAPYFVAPAQAGHGGPSAAAGAGAALACLLAAGDAVLCWHASQAKRLPRELCDRLSTSLVTLANKATQQGLFVASVRCLCALARTEQPGGGATTPGREVASDKVVQMARRAQGQLLDSLASMRGDGAGVDTKAVSKYFAMLGLLARHGAALLDGAADAEEGGQEQQVPDGGGQAVPSPLRATSLLKLFSKYMRTADGTLQTAALRACGGVLVAHPALLLPEAAKAAGGSAAASSGRMAVVHKVALNPTASALVKGAALQNLTDVFSQQEAVLLDAQATRVTQRPEASHTGKTSASGRKRKAAAPSGDGNDDAAVVPLSATAGGGDSSVCGALAQHFWEAVLGLVPDPCLDVRRKALACVEILIRGGLVMPMHAVPRLMAACCDDDLGVRRVALRMLAALTDTDPMFLVTRCGEGIHAAWDFRRGLAAASAEQQQQPPEAVAERAIVALGDLYWRFRGVKNLRSVMVTALMRMLQEDNDSVGEQNYQGRGGPANGAASAAPASPRVLLNDRLSRQRFAACVLVGLPFCGVEEPASVVASLNRVISTKGAALEGQLKAHSVAGAASGGAPPGEVARGDAARAMGVALCLLAKARLRLDFGLTDALMLKFNAGEGPAPVAGVDKMTQPLARVGGDQAAVALDTSCVPAGAPTSWDSLGAVATLIKRLMRDDSDDFEGAQQAPQLGARKGKARKSLATQADVMSPGGDATTPGVAAEREEALAAAAASTGAASRRGRGRGARGRRVAARGRGGSAKKKGGKRSRAEWSDSGEEDDGEAPLSEDDGADGDDDTQKEVMPKKRLRLA